MISLLHEVMGEEESSSKREKTVKKALAKESNLEVRKRRREPGTWGDVESLVNEAERGDKLKDWRTAAFAVVCYFGCCRLSDVIRVKVEDIVMERDKVTLWMKTQKTDKLNEGDSFSMAASGDGFSIKRFLETYISVMGLKGKDALFPKNLRKGAKGLAATYSIMYQALEGVKVWFVFGQEPYLAFISDRFCHKREYLGGKTERGEGCVEVEERMCGFVL